jgi:hypothetical protein
LCVTVHVLSNCAIWQYFLVYRCFAFKRKGGWAYEGIK